METTPIEESHKPTKAKRSRALVVSVTLSGPVAAWVKAQAEQTYRTNENLIAWCIAEQMWRDNTGTVEAITGGK